VQYKCIGIRGLTHYFSTAEISEQYSKTQPLDKRKLGFGSHDATKSGEFTCYKATERYRSLIKTENKLRELHRNAEKDKDILSINAPPPLPPKDKNGNVLEVPKFTFDVGRSSVTPYNPNTAHDSFYTIPKHAKVDSKLKGKDNIRRLGSHRPTSATIGEYAWTYNYTKPEHCRRSRDDCFDHGHLECTGF
jgi:hypothetical protein